MRNVLFVITGFCCLVLGACRKDIQRNDYGNAYQSNVDELQTDFAKSLAKAVSNPALRSFLKQQALKQFDNDYDVLVVASKHLEISPGQSFFNSLVSDQSSEKQFETLLDSVPSLTVFVPNLPNFSAGTWETQSVIPLVAVLTSANEDNTAPIKAYDQYGKEYQLQSRSTPSMPVIVVKQNERILSLAKDHVTDFFKSEKAAGIRLKSDLVYETPTHSLFFRDSSFHNDGMGANNGNTLGESSIAAGYPTQPKGLNMTRVIEAFNKRAASQRDYVYYNILNSTDRGPLDPAYGEYLCGLILASSASPSYVNDDPTTDWGDGNLEFQIDALFFNGSSAMSNVSKVVGVPIANLYVYGDSRYYFFNSAIRIAPWDVKANGNTWKYVVNEIDPGTVTTQTYTSTSKFGGNFTFEATIQKVVKIGFGVSNETTSTKTTTIQITSGSDFCGQAVVNFVEPVITQMVDLGWGVKLPIGESFDTGTVNLFVLPGKP